MEYSSIISLYTHLFVYNEKYKFQLKFQVFLQLNKEKVFLCTYKKLESLSGKRVLSTSGYRLQFLITQFPGGGFLLYRDERNGVTNQNSYQLSLCYQTQPRLLAMRDRLQ